MDASAPFYGDTLWRVTAYRKALFLGDLAWSDVTKRAGDARTIGVSYQLYPAIGSVGANIAEGCGKRGNGEFQRFLQIASGSASEVEYHLLLAHDLGYLTEPAYLELMQHLTPVRRMLTSLIQKVDMERQLSKN